MTEHLGYEKHDPAGNNSGNSRNGGTTKTLKAISERCLWRRRAIGTKLRAEDHRQEARTRFTGFDDKNHLHVRARHEHA